MRIFFVFFFVCLFLASSASVQASVQEQFPFTARVKADHVNVRAGQSNNYESLAELNKGDEVVAIGKSYSWYKVRLPEGSKMFIRMDYARLLTADIGEITGDRVNIRARANTDAAIIGQFVNGDQFFIKENMAGWLWIRPVAKAQGWIHEQFIEFKSKQVPAQLFPDPKDAAVKAKAEKEVQERKRAAKFAVLKPAANGQYEVQGLLTQEGTGLYKLMGGDKGDVCLAYADGPASVLANFLGARVVVRGSVKDDLSREAVLLNVVKINLAL